MGMLASGDEEGSIRLWDVATGLCRRVFEGHQNGVTSLAISPCGRRMASASWDNTIRIWDLESGREQAVLHRPSDERPGRDMFVGVAWTLDGRAVIAASLFSEVIFWDIDTSQQFAVLRAHTGNLTGLAISPNGRILATASEDSTVKLWDLGTLTGQNRAVVQYIERGTDRAAWVGAGVASGAPQIFISPDVTLTGHTGPIAQVAFSPDSRQLATSAVDGTVRLWDAATGQQTIMFDGHTGSVSCVAFASDGRTLASGGNDRTIRTWDVHAARPHRAPSSDLVDQWAQEMPVPSSGKRDERPGFRVAATVQTLGFSPDSRLLAIGGQKVRDDLSIENLTLRHVRTGKQQPHVQTSSLFVRGFAFCDGGRQLIANAQTTPGVGRVVRWNLETGEEQLLFINETESIWSLAVTPDGKKLYAATGLLHQRGTVVEFDMATRQRSIRFRKEGDYVRALVLSPDGSVLVAATGDGGVIVWRDDAEQPQSFRAHHQRVLQVAFAADGRSFATASSDATVKIWDVITLRQTGALVGHTHGVTSLAWSPEGKTLASGSADGTIKLWDPLISHERMSIDNKAGVVRSLAFSADGSILAAGTEDGAVFLFEASSSSECDSMRKTSGN
jgi:WD40 repeat protein